VLAHDAPGAREVFRFAAALLDGPGHIGFDRRRGGVKIVAVEAKPGFQAQAVTRAEAYWLHFGMRQQRFGQFLGVLGEDENLVAVFGEARAGA
jgi:hypothetical protein